MLYFPSPTLAWTYVGVLTAVLAIASVVDGLTLRIPKPISLGLLAGGLVASLVRGAWLGNLGRRVYFFPAAGPVVGAADAFLLALGGAVLGFVLFLVLWKVGVCGGGDVKLFAGLSSWIDPALVLGIMGLSMALVCLWILALWAVRIARGSFSLHRPRDLSRAAPFRGRRVSYSLPLAVAAGVVLFVSWFDELVPDASPPRGGSPGSVAEARR